MSDQVRELQILGAQFLAEAERLYGPRLHEWSFAGVGFHQNGPHLFFQPLTADFLLVHIHLHRAAAKNHDMARFQLAHEVVHLLAPGVRSAPMIEEGLAVKFSLDGPAFFDPRYRDLAERSLSATYREALQLIRALLAEIPDAIPRLRKKVPKFSEMRPSFLVDELGIDHSLAEQFCRVEQMR